MQATTLEQAREGAAGGARELLALAAPLVLSNASSTLMTLVDTALVGGLGAAEVAGVGLAGVVIWGLFAFVTGTLTAVATFVAQSYGAGRLRHCGAYAWNGLWLSTSAVLPTLLVLLGARPLIGAIATPEVVEAAMAYAHIRVFATAAFVVTNVFQHHLRGCGDTRTPMWVDVAANVVNGLLAWTLIYGHFGAPALGVEGAAIGTLLAQSAALLAFVVLFLSRGSVATYGTWPPTPPQSERLRELLRVGLPVGGAWVLDMAGYTMFNLYIGTMGTTALAVTTIVMQIQSVSFMQMAAVGQAATTLVGQYVGAGRLDLAWRSGSSALRVGAFYGLGVAVLFAVYREDLVAIFTSDALVLDLGATVILWSALMQLLDAPGIAVSGALRGAGDTRFAFWAGTFAAWGVMLPLAYLLGSVAEYGIDGAWVGMVAWAGVLSALLYGRFQRGAWQRALRSSPTA